MKSLKLTKEVYSQIERAIGTRPAEHGGMLGGFLQDRVVRHFHFDSSSRRSTATYSPDHMSLNDLLRHQWNPKGIRLLGFVHSHPSGYTAPSQGDLAYARRILHVIPDLDQLFLPIVMTRPDTGDFSMHCFAAVRNGQRVSVEERDLLIVKDESHASSLSLTHMLAGHDVPPRLERVRNAYDLDRLARCRIVAVGVGGAISYIDNLARTGVGEFVLIDPDKVDEYNIGTQRVYLRDLGRPKVEVVAEFIRWINPSAKIACREMRLEEIDDQEFSRLALDPLTGESDGRPLVTLLCGLTDSFEAQARVNRLALHLGLPALGAQVYEQGRGAEITFMYPGVTPACQRCALSSRYEHYLERGFRNDVTSDGTPIWSTERLNALKGEITMAILHHGTAHPRYGRMLVEIGSRNLIQIRMDPHIGDTLRLGTFDKVLSGADLERIYSDETIWLPQKPDCPENGFPACPDCGGIGDLRVVRGGIADTRVMLRGGNVR